MVRAGGRDCQASFPALLLFFGSLNRAYLSEGTDMLPWQIFNNAISDRASDTIFSLPAASRAEQAAAVVQDIRDMYDAGLNSQVGQLGFGFTAFVWTSTVPAEYTGIIIEGESNRRRNFGAWGSRRRAIKGAVVYDRCQASLTGRKYARDGTFGWPCPSGGAVYVEKRSISVSILDVLTTAETKLPELQKNVGERERIRCIVHYFPFVHERAPALHLMWRTFSHAFSEATKPEMEPRLHNFASPNPINLTNLAVNFYELLPKTDSGGRSRVNIFKAFLCVPIYDPEHEIEPGHKHVFDAPNLGISAEAGHIAVDSIAVPLPPDLNSEPRDEQHLRIVFVAAVPAGRSE